MKKLGLLAVAFGLVMTMTQCKKENTVASNDEGVKVPITLNVSGASIGSATGGSRITVTTETGEVTFENGDVIHVSSNGTYVGTLTYNGTQFAGEIDEPTEGQKLQFYFLGNKTPEFSADNTGCSVVISDQIEYLPVISYSPSRENYQVGKTDYNATLLNKCALVKFEVVTSSEAATCIIGMNNKVTVDFTNNSFGYSQDSEGIITLPAGIGEHWAILLPQDEVTEADALSADGAYTGTCGTVPAIAENDYLTAGITVAIETPLGPVGIINGAFTINANGEQVYFSQGNLQYQASTNTWRFAEHQWDYVGTQTPDNNGNAGGTINGSDNKNISQTYDGWIDLFGWGTSGYNHGANAYQPWSISRNNSDYYAYGNSSYYLYDQTGQADWGYNAISNGGNTENSGWRTLSQPEWDYLFNTRGTASGIRFAKARVNGVKGVILLPDGWDASFYTLNYTNSTSIGYNNNTISSTDWINVLEANGAVFLPAGGMRTYGTYIWGASERGFYWSASYSYNGYIGNAYGVHFTSSACNFNATEENDRYKGQSVRLVRNAE